MRHLGWFCVSLNNCVTPADQRKSRGLERHKAICGA